MIIVNTTTKIINQNLNLCFSVILKNIWTNLYFKLKTKYYHSNPDQNVCIILLPSIL